MSAMRYQIGKVAYLIDHDQHRVTSEWPDGVQLVGCPVYDDESRATARELGYGDDEVAVWLMTIDHDACHHLLAVSQGEPYSHHLRRVATGEPQPDRDAAHREECVVFLLQRLSRDGVIALDLLGNPEPVSS